MNSKGVYFLWLITVTNKITLLGTIKTFTLEMFIFFKGHFHFSSWLTLGFLPEAFAPLPFHLLNPHKRLRLEPETLCELELAK